MIVAPHSAQSLAAFHWGREVHCVFRQSEHRFHAIVNARCVLAAEDTDIGSGVHDDIGDGPIPALPCSLEQQAAVLARGGAGLAKCSDNEYTILKYEDAP
jgi:hypothetical protein